MSLRENRRGRNHRRKSHSPETAFRHATSLLNTANVEMLWKLSARLSLHEAFTKTDDPLLLLPVLNTEILRVFDQVIIASRADSNKTRIPTETELRNALNDCVDISNNTESLARLMRANHTDRVHLEFERFLSQMANVQFPLQESRPRLQAGRMIAMFHSLPRSHSDILPLERRPQTETLLDNIDRFLTVPLYALAESFLTILFYQRLAHLTSRRLLDAFLTGVTPAVGEDQYQNAIISGLLQYETEDSLDRWILFEPERLAGFFALERAAEFQNCLQIFLKLFSASTDELRTALEAGVEFSVGHISSRLSPLERYPIVRMGSEEQKLIVPNYWHLAKSFGPVIDFSLLDQFGNSYSHVRGTLQELYLRCLLEDRLPNLVIIPETTYGRPELRGPDLTLIDQQNSRIILIESKGRRMTLNTRLTMDHDTFNSNLDEVYGALLGLPQKLKDLYAGRTEYSHYQSAIDLTRGSEPIFIVVLSEGVYFMSHLIRLQSQQTGDRLYGFNHLYCVLSLDRFERAVEIARANERPLYELLERHYQRSGALDHVSPAADMFDGVEVDEDKTFAAQWAPTLPQLKFT